MYSQRDEEQHILAACKGIEKGRFLDIGGFDPFSMSNTRALVELGWTGVFVEPSPKCVRALVQEYGDKEGMTVIAAAVGLEEGFVRLRISDDAVSSSDANNIAEWTERGGYLGWMTIGAITIGKLLEMCGSFNMVSIDTEGTSGDLFKVLLATEMFPKCIVVEHDNRLTELQIAAQARGYHTVYVSTENLIVSL